MTQGKPICGKCKKDLNLVNAFFRYIKVGSVEVRETTCRDCATHEFYTSERKIDDKI